MMNPPFVSIIMPIHNEATHVIRSLESVLGQEYPSKCIEIIITDGMSSDGTKDIIQGFQDRHTNITVIDNPKMLVSTGLNKAIQVSNGAIFVRVDGHCEIPSDYVPKCVNYLQNENVDGVGGSIETIGNNKIAQVISMAMSSRFGVGDSAFRTQNRKTMLVDTVPFPAYSRQIIEEAGLYDEELVRDQDDEYNYRIREMGGRILLAADVKSKYYSRSSLRSLWNQYFQYGFWKVRVLQKHPRQMRPRQFVPPAFVASILGSAILSLFHPAGKYLFACILSAHFLANLVASVWTARKTGWEHLPLLPFAYAILHLSYGLGFLVGLVRFVHRWRDKQGKVPQWKPCERGSQGAWELGSEGASELGDAD